MGAALLVLPLPLGRFRLARHTCTMPTEGKSSRNLDVFAKYMEHLGEAQGISDMWLQDPDSGFQACCLCVSALS